MKLSEAARGARNKYQREYKLKNPDKARQYNINYWERKAAESNIGESLEDKINRLHKEGFSLREIAGKVGINHVKVSRILKA